MKQTITWTALPNCSVELSPTDSLLLSLHVSPRLEPEGGSPLLQGFPDFSDWPSTLKNIKFKVIFRSGLTLDAKLKSNPDSQIWQGLFPATSTRVKQFTFERFDLRPIKSFLVSQALTDIRNVCVQYGVTTPINIPSPIDIKPLIERSSLINIPAAISPKLQSQAPNVGAQAPNVGAQAPQATGPMQVRSAQIPLPTQAQQQQLPQVQAVQSAQSLNVSQVSKIPAATRVALPSRVQLADKIDFHAAIGSLGMYPELMRLLGLVIELDLQVSVNKIPDRSSVRVVPVWTSQAGANNRDFSPWTKYQINHPGNDPSKSFFMAVPKPRGDLRPSGLLGLDRDDYHIIEVDVDGAALKMAKTAQTLSMVAKPAQPQQQKEDTDAGGVPTLSTAGLSVTRDKRSEAMKNAFDNSKALNDALTRALSVPNYRNETDLELYLDDVVRGYRVDIQDNPGSWRSLCQRVGTYTLISNGKSFELEDEGFVQSATTSAADDNNANAPVFLHETIFRWAGWSLSAPRPGKTVMPDGSTGDADGNEGAVYVKTQFRPKEGTLPRLRFGKKYRLRARAVDLAGNSVPLDKADGSVSIPPSTKPAFTYQRYEPVASPVLVPRSDVDNVPGESVSRLAIRTANTTDRADTSLLPPSEYRETHIVPPRTSEYMAETHGMFDSMPGGMAKQYSLINEMDHPLPTIHPGEVLNLQYLPDPFAKGVVFSSYSSPPPVKGPENKWKSVLFKGTWPKLNPFRLRIVDGPNVAVEEPTGPDQSMILTVRLPKAEILTVRLRSMLPEQPATLDLMGPYNWMREAVNIFKITPSVVPPAAPSVAPSVVPKSVSPTPTVVPKTPVRVLQAQQSPTVVPSVKQVVPSVKPIAGQVAQPVVQQQPVFTPVQMTVVPIAANLKAAALSAAQESRHWLLTPYREIVLVHAVQQPIGRPKIGDTVKAVKNAEGDTYATLVGDLLDVHKKSTGKIDMLAEWEEVIDDVSKPLPQDGVNSPAIPRQAHVFSEIIDYPPDNNTTYTLNKRHEFGDTKYRPVNYTVISTTRFREYFNFTDEDIDSGKVSITRTSAKVKPRDVPSSARPDAPSVLYVMPLFKWQTLPGTVRRFGGAVRVYVERPWYSSGAREMLGVVLAPDNVTQLSDEAAQQLTVWGTDPIWKSGAIPYYPSLKQFPNAVKESGLTLVDDPSGRKVSVAAFSPQYDKERQLWFFDIEIDRTYPTYFPFLRLALARYQPISLRTPTVDYKLSKVVTAEYVQLTPDRTLSVTKHDDIVVVTLNHGGLKADGTDAGTPRSKVMVSIEQQTGKGDLGWAPAGQAPTEIGDQPTLKAWTGRIKLPAVKEGVKLRVVAKEYELYPPSGERIVYAGTVEI